MALVTFGTETTTWTGSGGNGFGKFRAGNDYSDRLGGNGRQWRWYLPGWEPLLGLAREATGGNGFGNFRAGNHYSDGLGRQWEAMALVTFEL